MGEIAHGIITIGIGVGGCVAEGELGSTEAVQFVVGKVVAGFQTRYPVALLFKVAVAVVIIIGAVMNNRGRGWGGSGVLFNI